MKLKSIERQHRDLLWTLTVLAVNLFPKASLSDIDFERFGVTGMIMLSGAWTRMEWSGWRSQPDQILYEREHEFGGRFRYPRPALRGEECS